MIKNLLLKIIIIPQVERELWLKVRVFNVEETDYFIKSTSPILNVRLQDLGFSILGPSSELIKCNLCTERADIDEPATAVKLPAESFIESGNLPFSGICYFGDALTGTYKVKLQTNIALYDDENLEVYSSSELLSGETLFELD